MHSEGLGFTESQGTGTPPKRSLIQFRHPWSQRGSPSYNGGSKTPGLLGPCLLWALPSPTATHSEHAKGWTGSHRPWAAQSEHKKKLAFNQGSRPPILLSTSPVVSGFIPVRNLFTHNSQWISASLIKPWLTYIQREQILSTSGQVWANYMPRHPGLLLSLHVLVTLRKASENSSAGGGWERRGSPDLGTVGSWNHIPVLPTKSYVRGVDTVRESQCSPLQFLLLCNTQLHQELDIIAPLLPTPPNSSPCWP